jgi:methyl-accepting chemotaxis protein
LSEFQVQDVTRQRVEAVQEALTDLDHHLQGMAGQLDEHRLDPDGMSVLRQRMKAHADRYVMHSQRATHQAVTGQVVAETADQPRIEMF